jgi:hypothetical protein
VPVARHTILSVRVVMINRQFPGRKRRFETFPVVRFGADFARQKR